MSEGRKSLCFSPQNITWKGHTFALAMPMQAHECPPSYPAEVLSKKLFTSNAAKAEYLKTGFCCTSSKEAGLGQVQASEDRTGRLFDSP